MGVRCDSSVRLAVKCHCSAITVTIPTTIVEFSPHCRSLRPTEYVFFCVSCTTVGLSEAQLTRGKIFYSRVLSRGFPLFFRSQKPSAQIATPRFSTTIVLAKHLVSCSRHGVYPCPSCLSHLVSPPTCIHYSAVAHVHG